MPLADVTWLRFWRFPLSRSLSLSDSLSLSFSLSLSLFTVFLCYAEDVVEGILNPPPPSAPTLIVRTSFVEQFTLVIAP